MVLVVLGFAAAAQDGEDTDAVDAASPATTATTTTLLTTTITLPTTTITLPTTTITLPTTTTTSSTTTPVPTIQREPASVVSVTDGDTLRVRVGGTEERLRLIGINAPESGECYASEASEALRHLVGGEEIRLERDTSDRDQFERLLRYVHVGGVLVNERLVEEGYAIARRYPPDTARADRLEQAQDRAESARRGLWAPDACGTSSDGSITIGRIHYDAAGDDNANLNDEWVELENTGTSALDLSGWGVKDESATHRYDFPDAFTLSAGAAVRLHTGCGTDTASALHWCNQGSAIWNNGGDTVFVLDPAGNIVTARSYSG